MAVCYPHLNGSSGENSFEVNFVPLLTGKEHRNFLSMFSGAVIISGIVILYVVITAPRFLRSFRLLFAVSLHIIKGFFSCLIGLRASLRLPMFGHVSDTDVQYCL